MILQPHLFPRQDFPAFDGVAFAVASEIAEDVAERVAEMASNKYSR